MCIYIISDDKYFVSGLKTAMAGSDTEMKVFNYESGMLLFYYCTFRQEDIVIVDLSYTRHFQSANVSGNTHYFSVKVVFVVDLPLQGEYSGFHPYWLISKKCPFKKILPLLKQLTSNDRNQTEHLSRKENIVLRELAGGRSTHFISRKLNLSAKTISSHKQNAFRKLGMSRLNDMSLVCYRQIINLYAGFSCTPAGQAGLAPPLPEKLRSYPLTR